MKNIIPIVPEIFPDSDELENKKYKHPDVAAQQREKYWDKRPDNFLGMQYKKDRPKTVPIKNANIEAFSRYGISITPSPLPKINPPPNAANKFDKENK
jgi:hypothetical protein